MRTFESKFVAGAMVLAIFFGASIDSYAVSTTSSEPTQTIRLKTKKRSKYVVRKTKRGSRTVARKSVRGTKKVGRKTWRGSRKVVSRTKKILW